MSSRDCVSSRLPSSLTHSMKELSLCHFPYLQSCLTCPARSCPPCPALSSPISSQHSPGSLPHPPGPHQTQGCPQLHHPRDTTAAGLALPGRVFTSSPPSEIRPAGTPSAVPVPAAAGAGFNPQSPPLTITNSHPILPNPPGSLSQPGGDTVTSVCHCPGTAMPSVPRCPLLVPRFCRL